MHLEVGVITFNVAMRKVEPSVFDTLFQKFHAKSPDIVAIGLQEVSHMEIVGGSTDTWVFSITEWMIKMGMTLVSKTFQATNAFVVFMKFKLVPFIKEISYRYGKNTLGGLTGHKGSIGSRILFQNNCSLIFVTSHFIHDVANLTKRIEQYKSNIHCTFPEYDNNSCVFWFGDFNFRVDLDPSEASQYLQKNELHKLLEYEQLTQGKKKGEIMKFFSEAELTFLPTYRLIIGSSKYDLKRTPSWCDRIFYKGSHVTTLKYESVSEVLISDHLPVFGLYALEGFDLKSVDFNVLFEHIPLWYSNIPLITRYRYEDHFWDRKGSYSDWIGIYPAHVDNILNPIKWQWVVTCFQQTVDEQKYYVCEFPPVAAGSYRLAYFSSCANCFVGMSKSFDVKEP